MSAVDLDAVLTQAQRLSPTDQAKLIMALLPTADTARTLLPDDTTTINDEDVIEQRETWAYLRRVLDQERSSYRPLFPEPTEQS